MIHQTNKKTKIMTNAQIILEIAVAALEAGKLTGNAKSFIESIKGYGKKELKGLSSAQYKFLSDIAEQHS